jgi:hypothetical protein
MFRKPQVLVGFAMSVAGLLLLAESAAGQAAVGVQAGTSAGYTYTPGSFSPPYYNGGGY